MLRRTLSHCNSKPNCSFFQFSFSHTNPLLHNAGLHLSQTHGFLNNNSCFFRDYFSWVNTKSLSAGNRVWVRPLFTSYASFRASFSLVLTKSYSDKPEITDDLLEGILCAVESSTVLSREVYNNIERLCRSGSVSAIADLLQVLRSKRIFLDSGAYNILLAATSEMTDIELSLVIFKDILVSSKGMRLITYINLAKAFSKTDDDSMLLKFVKEVAQLTSHCGVLALNRIIFAFAECRMIDKALMVFNHMKGLESKPDLVTYNTIVGLLGRAGLVDDMLQEFASMKIANIDPDVVTYNTLLNNLQKMGRFDLCLVYMREMDENGLIPDLRTYTALIESFGRSGNIEEGLGLLCAMKSKKVQPSIYIYRSLINNLKKMGKLKAAAALLDEMNDSLPYLVGPQDFKRKNR